MALITPPSDSTCSRFFKQIVEIAASSKRLGNFLETLLIIDHRTVAGIRLFKGANFGIQSGRLTGPNRHFPTVGKFQSNQRAIGGNHTLAFAHSIAHLEAAHLARSITGECFAGDRGNFGNDLGLGHATTPDAVNDSGSVGSAVQYDYCTKVQPGAKDVKYFTSGIKR